MFLGSLVRRVLFAFGASALLVGVSAHASQLTFAQPGFTSEVILGPQGSPTAAAFGPNGQVYVLEKSGLVYVWVGGARLGTPFIDLRDQVCDCYDRGLLGIAVDPEFPQKPYIYLLFTYDPPGVSPQDNDAGGRVSRLIRVEADPLQGYNVAVPGSTVPNNSPATKPTPMRAKTTTLPSCGIGVVVDASAKNGAVARIAPTTTPMAM